MIHKIEDVWLHMDKRGLPGYMVDGMERYLFQRIKPGDFMLAMLENNFRLAVLSADSTNLHHLGLWATFLVNDIPSGCWGSKKNVRAWLEGDPTDVL